MPKSPGQPLAQSSGQFHRNYHPHSSLQDKTPAEAAAEKSVGAPFWDEVIAQYDPEKAPIRVQSQKRD